jgi:gamma-glutamyl:cysteine ligase YbdK (ATP-grasp superfamily)
VRVQDTWKTLEDAEKTLAAVQAHTRELVVERDALRRELEELKATAQENKWYAEKHGEQATRAEIEAERLRASLERIDREEHIPPCDEGQVGGHWDYCACLPTILNQALERTT